MTERTSPDPFAEEDALQDAVMAGEPGCISSDDGDSTET